MPTAAGINMYNKVGNTIICASSNSYFIANQTIQDVINWVHSNGYNDIQSVSTTVGGTALNPSASLKTVFDWSDFNMYSLYDVTSEPETVIGFFLDGTEYKIGGSGGGEWGTITGTLSDQTDLQAALNGKQDSLATQTAYSAKGSATKVPQITTNTLGQVTGITEVNVTYPSQVSDTAYASSWNGVTTIAPSKNAVYDKIAAMDTTIGGKQDAISDLATIRSGASAGATALQPSAISDAAYASSWNGVTTVAPSKNAVYDKISAMDTTISGKQATLVSGTNIKTINSTSLLGSGNISIAEFNPGSGTTGQVLTKTANSYAWSDNGTGDMSYSDFGWATKSGVTVTLDLASTISPAANFTVNAPSSIKDGQTYILRVSSGETAYTMTLGTNITNPYDTDITLTANGLDQFVFLAIGGNLELQPEGGGGGGSEGGEILAPNSPLKPKYRWYGTQEEYEALSQYYTDEEGDTVYYTV